MKSIYVVTVEHDNSIKAMPDLIGGRIWSIQSVENTSSREAVHVTDITANANLLELIFAEAEFKK